MTRQHPLIAALVTGRRKTATTRADLDQQLVRGTPTALPSCLAAPSLAGQIRSGFLPPSSW